MKEVILYTLENKMMYVLMWAIATLFYLFVVYFDYKRKKPMFNKNIITVIVTFAMSIIGMLGFLNVMLG